MVTISTERRATIDGRTARSARTRRSIANAMLALIEDGVLRPTAPRVAERAGVSLRSVFHHFRDMEALYAIAADTQTERISALVDPTPADLPLPERIDGFVSRRTRLLEALTPVRRAVLIDEPFSAVIHERLRNGRERLRDEVARVFAAELDELPAFARRDLLAGLAAASEWTTWEALRNHQGLPVAAARRVMRQMIAAILAHRCVASARQ